MLDLNFSPGQLASITQNLRRVPVILTVLVSIKLVLKTGALSYDMVTPFQPIINPSQRVLLSGSSQTWSSYPTCPAPGSCLFKRFRPDTITTTTKDVHNNSLQERMNGMTIVERPRNARKSAPGKD